MKQYTKLTTKLTLALLLCMMYSVSYSQSCATFDTISVSSCDSYIAPSSDQYFTSGTFNDTILNVAGCDSIITISLQIFPTFHDTIVEISCSQYWSPQGNNYNQSGFYVEYYISVNDCDSIITIDLTIASPVEVSQTISACDQYNSDAGLTYTSSGIYQEVFLGSNGCDSTITYDLTVTKIDTTVVWTSPTQIEAVENDAAYQWINCNDNNAVIPGATNKVYEVLTNGSYACIISKNGCIDTTVCLIVESLSIQEDISQFSIYPNPAIDRLSIKTNSPSAIQKMIQIIDVSGKLVFEVPFANDIDLSSLKSGIYFVVLESEGVRRAKKLIVE